MQTRGYLIKSTAGALHVRKLPHRLGFEIWNLGIYYGFWAIWVWDVGCHLKTLNPKTWCWLFLRFNVPGFGAGDGLARAAKFGLEAHEAQGVQVFWV